MNFVKPKKHLGQHFLTDKNIARKICSSLTLHNDYKKVLEIGPGKGILSEILFTSEKFNTYLIEIDNESYQFLIKKFEPFSQQIIHADFLTFDLAQNFQEPFAVIGNFPYNISSQILFKIYENKHYVSELVGMFQKEVAERIASPPGSKKYGILSVLLQAFYDIELLFTVNEKVFFPPPKVKSAVMRMKRNKISSLGCDEKLFENIVKSSFNQRRKTLRNALRTLLTEEIQLNKIFDKRAEQLSVQDFVEITFLIENNRGK